MFPNDMTSHARCVLHIQQQRISTRQGWNPPTLTPSMSFLCVFYHKAAKELRASYCFGKGLNWILKLSFYLWYGGLIWLDIWMFTASACFAVFGIVVVCSISWFSLLWILNTTWAARCGTNHIEVLDLFPFEFWCFSY